MTITSIRPPLKTLGFLVVSVTMVALTQSSAWARGRGGWGATRAYQQVFKQQMQYMQKQVAEMQAQEKADNEAFMKRFDTNKNGIIDGKEKGPAKKYLRDLENGKDPDRAINNLSRTRKSTGRKSIKTKRTSDKSTDKKTDK